jgi:hypothetical protein
MTILKIKSTLKVLPLLLMIGNVAFAQTGVKVGENYNTITTAVPFLRISPDARSGAMGDVGIATEADANSGHYNIAKVVTNKKKTGLSITYTPWLRALVPDINLVYVAGYSQFGENNNQAVSGSIRYFNLGTVDYRDNFAIPIGEGKPREYALDAGYSRKLSEQLSLGVAGRFVHSNLVSGPTTNTGSTYKPGNSAAVDIGMLYSKKFNSDNDAEGDALNIGAAITNLGTKMSYDNANKWFIPINLGVGTAYKYVIDEFNVLTTAVDFNKLLVPTPHYTVDSDNVITQGAYTTKPVLAGVFSSFSDAPKDGIGRGKEELSEINTSLGLEYAYQNQFYARAGYFYEAKYKGNRKFATVGLGFKYNVFTLNLSYVIQSGNTLNRNPLSNTLRFSLLFDFDKMKEQKKAAEAAAEE